MNDHKLKTEENNKGIFKQIGKDFKGNLQNILNEGDFKDLKEIIDYQNDTKNKPYLLLINFVFRFFTIIFNENFWIDF